MDGEAAATGDRVEGGECVGHGRVDPEGSVDSGEVEHASDRPVARHTDDAEVAVDALVVTLGGDDDGQPGRRKKVDLTEIQQQVGRLGGGVCAQVGAEHGRGVDVEFAGQPYETGVGPWPGRRHRQRRPVKSGRVARGERPACGGVAVVAPNRTRGR
jgi:hypothetical protein